MPKYHNLQLWGGGIRCICSTKFDLFSLLDYKAFAFPYPLGGDSIALFSQDT